MGNVILLSCHMQSVTFSWRNMNTINITPNPILSHLIPYYPMKWNTGRKNIRCTDRGKKRKAEGKRTEIRLYFLSLFSRWWLHCQFDLFLCPVFIKTFGIYQIRNRRRSSSGYLDNFMLEFRISWIKQCLIWNFHQFILFIDQSSCTQERN